MSIEIHILSSQKSLLPFVADLKSITKSVEASVKKLTPIGNIDVVFYDNPSATTKESGIGGFTPCANIIFFSLDPENPNFRKELPFQVAHEINHAIRFRTPIPSETLFEAMISEGLADHFAMEVVGRKVPPKWVTSLTEKQKKHFLNMASKEWDRPTYNHNAWFYGSEKNKIPRWAAYVLGYDFIAAYLQKNPTVRASDIISADAKLFR